MSAGDPPTHNVNELRIGQGPDNDTDHRDSDSPENPNAAPNDKLTNSMLLSPSKKSALLNSGFPLAHQGTVAEKTLPYESLVEYDPFVTPPDLNKAQIHLIASRIALDPKNKEDIGEVIDEIDSVIGNIPSTSKLMEEIKKTSQADLIPMKLWMELYQKYHKKLDDYFQNWLLKQTQTKTKQELNKKELAAKDKAYSSKSGPKGKQPIPNDDEEAKIIDDHQGKMLEADQVLSCPCCNRRAKTEKIKLNEGVSQIGNLGAGYVLFFKMNVMVNFINIFNLLVCLYPIIRNSLSSSCKKESDSIGVTTYAMSSSLPNCHLDFTTITSLANYNILTWDIIERLLLLLGMLIVVLMSCFWRISIQHISDKYESRADGPEDWTVLLKNIAPEHAQKIFIKNELEPPILNLDDYVKALIENCHHKTTAEMIKEEEEEKQKLNSKKNSVKPVNQAIKEKTNYDKAPIDDVNNAFNSHSSVANLKVQEKIVDLDADAKASSAAAFNNSKIDIGESNEDKEIAKAMKIQNQSKYSVVSTNYLYKCKELVALDKNLTKFKKELRTLLEKEPAKDKAENEKLKDMLNPQMNKKQFLGQVGDGVDNQINLDDFSLEFQIKFTKALFVSSKLLDTLNEILDARKRYYLGEVFVTFKTIEMAKDFKRQFKKYNEDLDEDSLLKGNIVGEIILLARAVKNAALGNQSIRIASAPKPTDIIWENLGIPYKSRVTWTALSYTFTILALSISFGIAVSIKAIQISVEKTSSEWIQRILSLVASVVNVITGLLLDFFINWFNEMEDHKQYSSLYDSLMIKVTLAQFINTNLLPLTTYLISVQTDQAIYYKGGLVTDVFFLLFSQMIVAPILLVLNPGYIISKVKQYFLRLRVDYSLANSVTQQEAHEIYQKPEVNLAILFAALFKPMFTSVFFIQILPITTLMASVAGLGIIYAVKINMFRTSRTPPPISSAIAHTALSIINMVPLVYGLGCVTFDSVLLRRVSKTSIASLVLGIIIALTRPYMLTRKVGFVNRLYLKIANSKVFEKLFGDGAEDKSQAEQDKNNPDSKPPGISEQPPSGPVAEHKEAKNVENQSAPKASTSDYNDYRINFDSEYAIANPVTSHQGIDDLEKFRKVYNRIKSDFKNVVQDWIKYRERPEFMNLDKKSKLYYIIERKENPAIEKKYEEEQKLMKQFEAEDRQVNYHNKTSSDMQIKPKKFLTPMMNPVQPAFMDAKAELHRNKMIREKGVKAKNSKARETERVRYASKINEDKMVQLLRKFNQIQLENAFGSVLFSYHNQEKEENTDQPAQH